MIINVSKINLSGCGGGGGTGSTAVISTKDFSITANGTTNITMTQGVDGISAGTITTNVQPNLTSETITSNGVYTPGSGIDGFDSVTVSVQPTLTSTTITSNGTYTPGTGVDGFDSVTVNVDGAENRLNKFFDNNLTAITQSDLSGVTQIRDYGCYGMSNLKSVDLPPSVTTLYQCAFRQSGIETIDVSNVTTFGQNAFSGCTSLTGITGFENYTGDIPNMLFDSCTALTGNLKVGGNITEYTQKCFNNCRSLTAITFVNNVSYCAARSANYNPFAGCTGIQYLDYTNTRWIPTMAYVNPFTAFTQNYEIRVPQSLYDMWTASTNWSNSAIVGHIVAYPDKYSVGAMKYTTSDGNDIEPNTPFTSMNWNSTVIDRQYDATTGGTIDFYGLTTLPDKAFSGNTKLTSIEIPEGVTDLASYSNSWDQGKAFSNCTGLTTVLLPSTLTTIPTSSFSQCKSLTGITIPDNVTTIGQGAFSNCYSLSEITVPDDVTALELHTFMMCTALTSVVLSSSLSTLYNEAFFDCLSLSEVTFRGTTPPTLVSGNSPFHNVPSVGTVYVPSGYESTYATWIQNNSLLRPISGWTISPIDECAGDPECECNESGGMWDGENCLPAPEDCAGDPECECMNSGGLWDPDNQVCNYPEPDPGE